MKAVKEFHKLFYQSSDDEAMLAVLIGDGGSSISSQSSGSLQHQDNSSSPRQMRYGVHDGSLKFRSFAYDSYNNQRMATKVEDEEEEVEVENDEDSDDEDDEDIVMNPLTAEDDVVTTMDEKEVVDNQNTMCMMEDNTKRVKEIVINCEGETMADTDEAEDNDTTMKYETCDNNVIYSKNDGDEDRKDFNSNVDCPMDEKTDMFRPFEDW